MSPGTYVRQWARSGLRVCACLPPGAWVLYGSDGQALAFGYGAGATGSAGG